MFKQITTKAQQPQFTQNPESKKNIETNPCKQKKNHTRLTTHKINIQIIKTWKYLKVKDNVNR
jgi:hypothetical protein